MFHMDWDEAYRRSEEALERWSALGEQGPEERPEREPEPDDEED